MSLELVWVCRLFDFWGLQQVSVPATHFRHRAFLSPLHRRGGGFADPSSMMASLLDAMTAAAITCLLVLLVFVGPYRRRRTEPEPIVDSLLWKPSSVNGFLPSSVPVRHAALQEAEELLSKLPELIRNGTTREACEALHEVDIAELLERCTSQLEYEELAERATLVYSFLAYAYLRASAPRRRLPRNLAVSWHTAATVCGRAPSLDYVATVLANGDGEAGPAATFSGLADEKFFYALHVRIERAAAPAVGALVRAAADPRTLSPSQLARVLNDVAEGVYAMAALLPEMPTGCDPKVFHETIRLRLAGFTESVILEGVRDQPTIRLTGASGAQSAVLPCVDALLGIGHSGHHELREWSVDTGDLHHLPPPHRALLLALRAHAPAGPAELERQLSLLEAPICDELTDEHLASANAAPANVAAAEAARRLRAAHADAVNALLAFRKAHFALVRAFIVQPGKVTDGGSVSPASVAAPLQGTGGSELGGFLSGRVLDTARARLADGPASWRFVRRVLM